MKTFTATARIALTALAFAAFGAQAAVPNQEDMGPVRQACPQIDQKLQQALDRDIRKLQDPSLARVEFTVKGDTVSKIHQQNVPIEMRRHLQIAVRQLGCKSEQEKTLAFNLNLLPN
ncbi:MAG: hypothetical protein CFE41_19300 [Burkholderiales bacterium PBB2]|nr:MAG: hypothetical protein CFE41_19300 [Burkholderiales bacterium PBB2]